jgi:hypothetical protein
VFWRHFWFEVLLARNHATGSPNKRLRQTHGGKRVKSKRGIAIYRNLYVIEEGLSRNP